MPCHSSRGGEIRSRDTEYSVSQGDLFILDAFEQHMITNKRSDEALLMLSVVVDDLTKTNSDYLCGTFDLCKKNLIISTPPTPNGDLHLGHLSGPYLRADILKRFLT